MQVNMKVHDGSLATIGAPVSHRSMYVYGSISICEPT